MRPIRSKKVFDRAFTEGAGYLVAVGMGEVRRSAGRMRKQRPVPALG